MAFGLFKKKAKKKDERYRMLTIHKVEQVARDTVNLVFEQPNSDFKYEPGQFITIIDTINGNKIRRAYSLCSTPLLNELPAVTVKRISDGIMSNYINDSYEQGQQVEIMEPMGLFTTDYDPGKSRHVVFFGGGSGITPLYSIMRTILVQEPKSKVTLIYGNREEDFIIFKKDLEKLAETYDQFNLIHILEENINGYADYEARPTPQLIMEITDKLGVNPETEFYICGPEPMMNTVREGLSLLAIPEENIRFESFEAGKTSPSEIIAPDDASATSGVQSCEITIELEGESYSLTLDKSRPILEQALDKGLDMPYSCQSGLCTACRGMCLEGEVSVDEVEGLTEDELEEGYVLTCIGKPLSDKLRIEIG